MSLALQPYAGAIQLADPGGPGALPLAATWTRVASRISQKATPTELRIDAMWADNLIPSGIGLPAASVQFPGVQCTAFVGQQNAAGTVIWESHIAGALRIIYGSQGVRRTLICDIRSMRLDLGVCDYITVEAMRWRHFAWSQIFGPFTLQADIGDKQGGHYDEPTATMLSLFQPALPVSQSMYIPPHAKWWTPICATADISLPDTADGSIWGSTNPDLFWGSNGGQDFTLSPAAWRWTPPLARMELTNEIFMNVSSHGVNLVTIQWIGARFWLAS